MPGWGTKIPHAVRPKETHKKQKERKEKVAGLKIVAMELLSPDPKAEASAWGALGAGEPTSPESPSEAAPSKRSFKGRVAFVFTGPFSFQSPAVHRDVGPERERTGQKHPPAC